MEQNITMEDLFWSKFPWLLYFLTDTKNDWGEQNNQQKKTQACAELPCKEMHHSKAVQHGNQRNSNQLDFTVDFTLGFYCATNRSNLLGVTKDKYILHFIKQCKFI